MIKLVTRNVFFTSDTHAYHKNICEGTSDWTAKANDNNGQSCRNFPNPIVMTEELVRCINKTVGENDVLIHCGDWSFAGVKNIYNFREALNVKEIHLVLGNHDHHIEKGTPVGVRDEGDGWPIMADHLFTTVQHVQTFELITGKGVFTEKETVFCSHYSHRVWDKSHHGRIHLYGHSHGSLEAYPLGLSMDVGVDNAFRLLGEYRPFSWEEIKANLAGRKSHIIDHHNQNTN